MSTENIDPARAAGSAKHVAQTAQKPLSAAQEHNMTGLTPQHQAKGDIEKDTAAQSKSRSRPVIKMKRTGHSGPFPLPGRSLLSPGTPTEGAKKPRAHCHRVSPVPLPVIPGMNDARPNPGAEIQSSIPHSESAIGSLKSNGSPKTATKSTAAIRPAVETSQTPPAPPTPSPIEQELPPTSTDTAQSHDEMSHPTVSQTKPTSQNSQVAIPPEIQHIFDSALDDESYKVWKDEFGNRVPTAGALLPAGYQKLDHPEFPWICPVRACRKMLPTLMGLGKHFCNSHRAAQLNDNLDGTLTDLGTYANPNAGNGKYSGSFAKPPIIVSKKAMTLAEAPMLEPTLHYRAALKFNKPTVPQRGGPYRRSGATETPIEDDEASSEVTDEATAKALHMANPDRPYDTWPDGSGVLVPVPGGLFPDGYKQDDTIPGLPWICPIRSCRHVFRDSHGLGYHLKTLHSGCRLNDNLDGTLSILSTDDVETPPVIVSRIPRDHEPIVAPSSFLSESSQSKKARRLSGVPGHTGKESPVPASPVPAASAASQTESSPDIEPHIISDVGIDLAADGRPYRQWWSETGELISMAGALIPDGYKLDDSSPHGPWICPVRSCRALCRDRRALGHHFMATHRSDELNDNSDGTFSVVGSHQGAAARVVSRKPLNPNNPPVAAPRLPPNCLESRKGGTVPFKEPSTDESTKPSTYANPEPFIEQPMESSSTANTPSADPGKPERLWSQVCLQVGKESSVPDIPELKALLKLPQVRDLAVTHKLPQDLSLKQVSGLIIQAVGEENPTPCTECRRHEVPYSTCVSVPEQAVKLVFGYLGTSSRSCANCTIRKQSSACSLRKLSTLPWNLLPQSKRRMKRKFDDMTELDDEDSVADLASEGTAGRRRTRGAPALSNTSDLWDVDDDHGDEEADTQQPPPLEPKSKIVTLRTRAASHSTAPESNLQMEQWEKYDGRVGKLADGKYFQTTVNLFYSTYSYSLPRPPKTRSLPETKLDHRQPSSRRLLDNLPHTKPIRLPLRHHFLPRRHRALRQHAPICCRREQDARLHASVCLRQGQGEDG
ncbi:hypothetical protein VTK26DRAFT_394 [Humicola hyalothermophila]